MERSLQALISIPNEIRKEILTVSNDDTTSWHEEYSFDTDTYTYGMLTLNVFFRHAHNFHDKYTVDVYINLKL